MHPNFQEERGSKLESHDNIAQGSSEVLIG
jgi:hypothetical protein